MKTDVAEELKEVVAELLKEYVPAPWGKLSAVIVSRYGQRPIQYFLPTANATEELDQAVEQPNFAVVGMGRCGSHVAVALHEMVFHDPASSKAPSAVKPPATKSLRAWIESLSKSNGGKQSLRFKPIMLVGDTDETTFADIAGLTVGTTSQRLPGADDSPVLTLSYSPLATSGVGNNPVISQFFTRALLSSPDVGITGQRFGWLDAKKFLLSVTPTGTPTNKESQDDKIPPRLAFYIFSAGGGTGCGAAAEVLRAQQFAAVSEKQNAVTYYCAVAVLPEPDRRNQTKRMLNMGRFIVQYLAEQAISLTDPHDYTEVPKYLGGSIIAVLENNKEQLALRNNGPQPVATSSWNSVLLVSNDIMNPTHESVENVIKLSNQYIAQQLFNLAGPQISAQNLKLTASGTLLSKNYEAVRLDAMDLLASLRGPCACCFAVATTKEVKRELADKIDWIKEMFMRAISLPIMREGVGLIEGISLCPAPVEDYRKRLETGGLEEKLSAVAHLPFFAQCGSIVFTLTAPQDGIIMQAEVDELMRLCSMLFPSLREIRYSAIYGTTDKYTLSIYVEGSVVFAPEIERAVKNYLRLCWPKGRRMQKEAFVDWWKTMLSADPPLTSQTVSEGLGEQEDLSSEYAGLGNAQQIAMRSWESLVRIAAKPEDQQVIMSRLTFDELGVKANAVASAVAFYNYFSKRAWLEMID